MVDKGSKTGGKKDFAAMLEEVAKVDTGVTRVRGGGIEIPEAFVKALKKKIEDVGGRAITLPKVWLEEQLGMKTNMPIKGRPNAIKKKLNIQWGQLLDEDKIWHVGRRGFETYVISIISVPDAASWKTPGQR